MKIKYSIAGLMAGIFIPAIIEVKYPSLTKLMLLVFFVYGSLGLTAGLLVGLEKEKMGCQHKDTSVRGNIETCDNCGRHRIYDPKEMKWSGWHSL